MSGPVPPGPPRLSAVADGGAAGGVAEVLPSAAELAQISAWDAAGTRIDTTDTRFYRECFRGA